MEAVKAAAKLAAVGSLPRRTLVAISQAEAALTTSVFLVSAIIFLAARVSTESSASHQSKAWVSSSARTAGYSQAESSSGGRGLKNFGPTRSSPLQKPR